MNAIRRTKLLTAICLALIGILFVQAIYTNMIPLPEREVPFHTISEGDSRAYPIAGKSVIRSNLRWLVVWQRARVQHYPRPKLSETPAINFSENTVVGIFRGTHNTGGYGSKVIRVVDRGLYVQVYYEAYSPGLATVTTSYSSPYELIMIPRTFKPVRFKAVSPQYEHSTPGY